jgi:predicted nucleotidyltransferase
MLPYSIEEITRRVSPVAKKYGLPAVFLFGSYARGEATAESDIDLLVDLSGTGIDSLLKLGGLYSDLEEALETSIDLVTLDSMEEPTECPSQLQFREAVKQERKMIYATA